MPAPPPDVSHLLDNDTPAWARIDFDVLCSRCGYNLRTLTAPRCTECGLDFEWPYVLHQAGCRSEFLFEHNWRQRPIRSLFDTIWRARNPWRFWRSVSIHDRVHVGPLVFMLLFSPAVMWLGLMPLAAWLALAIQHVGTSVFGTFFVPPPVWPPFGGGAWTSNRAEEWTRDLGTISTAPISWTEWRWVVPLAGAMILMHAVALGVVLLLRVSLRRIRVRGAHVLRAVAYSAGPISGGWALTMILSVSTEHLGQDLEYLQFIPLATSILVAAVYLAVAARLYLGIPHPRLLGFLAYLTGFLFVACLAVIWAVI